MRRGQPQKMNFWLRMRVLMQGLTIVAFVGGVYRLRQLEGDDRPFWNWGRADQGGKKPATEEAEVERAEFRERLRKAEEAHRVTKTTRP